MSEEETKPILVDRSLTIEERDLTRWILEHGEPGASAFVEQLDRARVKFLCPCGCASIDFAIEGSPDAPIGVHILGDFIFGEGDSVAGVFVFEAGGILKGLEVYGLAGDAPAVLPKVSDLVRSKVPFGKRTGIRNESPLRSERALLRYVRWIAKHRLYLKKPLPADRRNAST